jgi:hypothetical protein
MRVDIYLIYIYHDFIRYSTGADCDFPKKSRISYQRMLDEEKKDFVVTIVSILTLAFLSFYLAPKEQSVPNWKHLGISLFLLITWGLRFQTAASFWLGPFTEANLGPADSLFENEMQETGIIFIGMLWVLFVTFIFPVVQIAKYGKMKLRRRTN